MVSTGSRCKVKTVFGASFKNKEKMNNFEELWCVYFKELHRLSAFTWKPYQSLDKDLSRARFACSTWSISLPNEHVMFNWSNSRVEDMYVIPICFFICTQITVQTLYSICCLPTVARRQCKLAILESFSLLLWLRFRWFSATAYGLLI